jgi:hypothetical protein
VALQKVQGLVAQITVSEEKRKKAEEVAASRGEWDKTVPELPITGLVVKTRRCR